MFTGIVEEMGVVEKVEVSSSYRLRIRGELALEGTKKADSIAINGVCLTVIDLERRSFLVEVMSQTLNKTNLGKTRRGDRVNLERAVSLNTRLGGHLVTGDIDGVGRIKDINKERKQTTMQVQFPFPLARYIVNQGRVALEGVSLTVASCQGNNLTVNLIPFTLTNTTLGLKKRGDLLNLEVDIISKYIEKILRNNLSSPEINEEFLKKAGY